MRIFLRSGAKKSGFHSICPLTILRVWRRVCSKALASTSDGGETIAISNNLELDVFKSGKAVSADHGPAGAFAV